MSVTRLELYKRGYLMAQAIATDEGNASLTALLRQPEYAFAMRYLALPK